jgi:dihydroorotase
MTGQQILLQGGLVVDPATGSESVRDVRIADGTIKEIAEHLTGNKEDLVIDAHSLVVAPGLIDMHTHLRDFGQSDKEDISTATAAAAFGGYTTVLAMANTDPVIDNTAILSLLLRRIEQRAAIEVLPACCVTKGMAGVELTNMVDLADLGAAAFSDDGMPIMNLAVLRRALEHASLTGKTIISHAEDKDLSAGGAMTEGYTATCLGIPAVSSAAESAAVAREIEVARVTGGRLHFAHISCAASVDLIAFAKNSGIAITADVTPHHLALSSEEITGYDTSYKMNPPLREENDQKALATALLDGTIDAIATDHAPHTCLEKSQPFDQAPFGILGLETALPVTMQILVKGKKMSWPSFIALLTTRPAKILGLKEPAIKAGNRANICVIDPEHKWVYEQPLSKSSNSPFKGRPLIGKNVLTIANGVIVYQDVALISTRLNGAFLPA